ncbi:hypothetical protein OSCI_1060025 [Kamptonema sp. PCC 6506]|nr:hypothetical protein OSCI_1060025 [Kamptonema sp. PCC 6506]
MAFEASLPTQVILPDNSTKFIIKFIAQSELSRTNENFRERLSLDNS